MDVLKSPRRIDPLEFPSLALFPELSTDELREVKRLGRNITIVTDDSRKYILKKHVSSHDDLLFRREIEAYVTHEFSSSHIVEFVGYTTDVEDKVEAMVLVFSVNYDIRWYLQKYRPDNWKLKSKWVSQIAHGLMAIHEAGITHGDLRCENVVLDENLDARIIDIVQGQGYMDGWCPWKYPELESIHEPSWDMYSLGASIWEILTNGEIPPEHQALQFEFDIPDDEVALLLKAIAERCLSDHPKERPTAEGIYKELGGKNLCGCEVSA